MLHTLSGYAAPRLQTTITRTVEIPIRQRHACPAWATFLYLLFLFAAMPRAHADFAADYPQALALFPAADRFGEPEGNPPAAPVYQNDQLIGYAFLTADMVRIPAYSGRPINVLVGIDTKGRIAGARIVQHEEPILAAGVSEARLARYVDQYRGKPASRRIIVGARREGYATVDAISGATITVMVINATITGAVKMVAESRGIQPAETEAQPISAPAAPPPTAAPARPTAKVGTTPARMARKASPPPHAAPPAMPAPDAAIHTPAPPTFAIDTDDEEPIWLTVWAQRKLQITLLLLGLTLLTGILLFQDYLVRRPHLLARVRLGFLLYTLFFIGWYSLGQLSIINVLTFMSAVTHQFSWDTFLIDPMLFLLWSFVAITLLLWGRGVYCGWLCPFGALQELAYKLARKLRLPFFVIPHMVHERLQALKIIILLVLFGLSLQSMSGAIRAVEIEPFKTAITLRFQREWGYVAFALGVIALSAFNRKFYCKYICPLGAALIIPGRFHMFEWLRRRKECGKPCQVCAVECEIQAIRPTGEIVINECHHCLDCQVTYYDSRKCVPLVDKRKRREQLGKGRHLAKNQEEPVSVSRPGDIPASAASADKTGKE